MQVPIVGLEKLTLSSRHQHVRLHMARLLQIDVKSPANRLVRSREFINGFFDRKIAIFSTALVLGNRSMRLFLL